MTGARRGTGLRRAWKKHAGIARHFVRIGVIRKSQFRIEFISQVVMDSVWYASHILVFEILFEHTPSIAGWSVQDIRVFLGFLFVSDAFMMTWLGQSWHFGRELKDGKLDPVRVRPASPIFLYFFQRFSLEGVANLVIAAGYLMYGMVQAKVPLDGATLGLVLWAVALSWWARVVLTVGFSIWEFYLLNSDLSRFSNEFFTAAADRPLDIFTRRVKQFLLHLVPIGALTHIPSSMVLRRYDVGEALLHTLWLAVLGLLVFRLWRAGFRRYESALG